MKFEIEKYPNQTLLYFPSNHILERLPGIAEGLRECKVKGSSQHMQGQICSFHIK